MDEQRGVAAISNKNEDKGWCSVSMQNLKGFSF
jgi:hypothetical protein